MEAPPLPAPSTPPPIPQPSGKRILPAVALAGTVGFLGLHRLYAGRYITGALQLIMFVAGMKLLGHDLRGIAALRTFDDALNWASENTVQPGPVLLVSVPAFWALADCLALLARRFKDGAGRRMTRWI